RGMAPLGDSDVEIGFVGRLSVLPVVFFLGRRHGKSLASSRGRRLRPHDRLARALVRHREPAAYRAELQAAVAVARLVLADGRAVELLRLLAHPPGRTGSPR